MLKDSAFTRLFIRCSVFGLRSIAPLSTLYWSLRLTFWTPDVRTSLLVALDIYTASEAAFYFLVYLPRSWLLNRPAKEYLALKTREERRQLWMKTWDATPDPHEHTSLWFKGAPIEELRREEVKDWIVWALWNSTTRNIVEKVELAEYVAYAEQVLKIKFPDGRSVHEPLLITAEPLNILHRPLLWYLLFIGGVDFLSSLVLLFSGYRLYSLPLSGFFNAFPFRPLSFLTSSRSPAKDISYWYREHTSRDQIPVLFIHGIGIGVFPYVSFFRELRHRTGDPGIGLIALEVMPVCSRITKPVLHREDMLYQIQQILHKHGWTRCILMTHSYGSVIAAQLLRNPKTAPLIGPLIFVDPVTFSFHAPYIAWNFLRRKPTSASEIELHYFASTDADVNHALTRSFIWPEVTLWRDEVEDRAAGEKGKAHRCTVAIAGKDIITNTQILGTYLTRREDATTKWYDEHSDAEKNEWKKKPWTGEDPLEVIWFPTLNHAEVFDDCRDRKQLMRVVKKYSRDGFT